MAKCRFQYSFPVEPEELVRRIDAAIRDAGGAFSGDAAAGSFSILTPVGAIAGSYVIDGQRIDIDVTQKPVFIPCSAIETKLNDYIRRV